jgi:hypothetical protein
MSMPKWIFLAIKLLAFFTGLYALVHYGSWEIAAGTFLAIIAATMEWRNKLPSSVEEVLRSIDRHLAEKDEEQ